MFFSLQNFFDLKVENCGGAIGSVKMYLRLPLATVLLVQSFVMGTSIYHSVLYFGIEDKARSVHTVL